MNNDTVEFDLQQAPKRDAKPLSTIIIGNAKDISH